MTSSKSEIAGYVNQLEFGTRHQLAIDMVDLTLDDATQLAAAIATHAPHMQSLSLRVRSVEEGAVATLLEPLHGSRDLQDLQIYGFPMEKTDAQGVADCLKSGTALTSLSLKRLSLTDDFLAPITEALQYQPHLETLSLTENLHSRNAYPALAQALAGLHSLTSLYVNDQLFDARDTELFSKHLTPATHPNLVNCSTTIAGNLARDNEQNLLRLLNAMNDTEYDCLPLDEFQRIERVMSGLYEIAKNAGDLSEGLADYEKFLGALPRPPKDKPAALDELLKTDHRGLCALDNPQLWRHNPRLLGELCERGQLSSASLDETTERGNRVIDYITAFAPTDQVVTVFANNGTPLRGDLLLDETGKASDALRFIQNQYGAASLFDPENWHGAKPHDVKILHAALDQPARDSVTNLHTLQAELRRSQRAQQRGA